MKAGIFYHKGTGKPVQIIARAQTKPTFQEVICYQELTSPYEHFVMEKRRFFAEYVKSFEELPLVSRRQIGKKDDLPDKQPRISKGEIAGTEGWDDDPDQKGAARDAVPKDSAPDPMPVDRETDPRIQKLLTFFDADTCMKKIKILETMKDDLDAFMLNNIAVSLDLSIEDGKDGYALIMSELRIRAKYEGERGERP